MQQTTNYNLNKFDSTDALEDTTRLGLNDNADAIDTALKGLQDDIDGLDAADVSYDNTDSGLTADNVQGAIDEITETESVTASMAGITWNRSGKVVAVSVKGTGLSSTSTTVTGLPTPKNPYLLSLLFYGNNMVGYLEYNNSNWSVRSVTGSGTSSYGSLTYIAD